MFIQYLVVRIFSVVDPCVAAGCSDSCTPQTSEDYQCECPAGFTLGDDKHICNNTNECDEGIAMCDHVCTDTVGSYVCTCRPGYRVTNVSHCEDINECLDSNDCLQTCNNTVGSYTCTNQEDNTSFSPGK